MLTSKNLLVLAIRLQDVKNLLEEEQSVSPNVYPGLKTETMGGPEARKKVHQKHDAPAGPRGVAESEEDNGCAEDKSFSHRTFRFPKRSD